MRKPIPIDVKHRMRDDLITNCKNPTGFPERKTLASGCGGYEEMLVRRLDGAIGRGSSVPRECRCWATFSCMQKHGDWGFDPKLFLHNIEDLRFGDRKALDAVVKEIPSLWDRGGGLYIHGRSIGCGKTTLAHLLVKRIYDFGANVHVSGGMAMSGGYKAWYMLAHEFCDRAWKGRDGFQEQIDWGGDGVEEINLTHVRVFVLDEFGRDGLADERKTKAGRGFFEPFLRERTAAGLITIIVSHLPPASVRRVVDEPALSLLSQTHVIEVIGEDRRHTEKSPFFGDT